MLSPLCISALEIKSFPLSGVLFSGGKPLPFVSRGKGVKEYNLESGSSCVFLRASGFRDKYIPLAKLRALKENLVHEYKLERMNTNLVFNYYLFTGSQPKSVRFSPDGKFLVAALLNGKGIEVFPMSNTSSIFKPALPSIYAGKKGFVETLFLKKNKELWVSQMTTGMIHVFSIPDFKYKDSFTIKGEWPKVLTSDKNENFAFVSNWVSKSVSVVKIDSHKVEKVIKMPGIPRGMDVTRDNKYLYVAIYGGGKLVKISLESFEIIKVINLGKGAPRHITASRYSDKLYLSDMYYGKIFIINTLHDKVTKGVRIGSNLNTIALSPDERYLFISSRGKNSPQGYLYKGPDYGKIFVYDTVTGKIIDWAWGMNQPTGLAVSPDGKTVAFTDFLDDRIEIYNWNMHNFHDKISR